MVLRLAIIGVVLAGCLTKVPPQQLAQQAPIAIAFAVDDLEAAPEPFKARLYEVLDKRNLLPREVPSSVVTAQRLTSQRFEALRAAAGDAPFLLLVEVRAQFFTQMEGRFRWTVAVKFTAARAGDPSTSDAADFPAVLLFEHQKHVDAINEVAEFVASRLAPLVDGLLQGHPGVVDAGTITSSVAPNDALYFVMVDRFENGDRSNDGPGFNGGGSFHGGDLAGVKSRLDWLEQLGVGDVWLSPVFSMRTAPFSGYPAWHGYWVERLDQVEPRFGSEGELRGLRNALAARGMGLYLDLVLNHVGPGTELTRTRPAWFHGRGNIQSWADPTQLVMNDVQGLPDLADERDDVYEWLRDAAVKWVRLVHPKGFRLDAVKHLPSSFWSRFNGEMKREGGADFQLLGEMLDGDPSVVSKAWRDGGFTSMFDFPLRFAMVDVFCKGQSPARLGAVLTEDRRYPDPAALVTLLDNHDLPRLATECRDGAPEAAVQLLYAMRGVPSIIWGTEAGFTGERDPENRAPMKFDEAAPMRAVIAGAAELRRRHPSLREGVPVIVGATETSLTLRRIAAHEAATLIVEGRQVRMAFEAGDFAAQVETAKKQWLTGEKKRRVDFTGSAGALVVGSGAELGGWKLERGLELPAAAELPVGGVFELKLVSKG
ncbi:MAG: glycosyl hydrolase, partial [Myxococcaceae bacterium]|nr:glycosyl hydrolase [Myxococcaceae bacterium]